MYTVSITHLVLLINGKEKLTDPKPTMHNKREGEVVLLTGLVIKRHFPHNWDVHPTQ